MGAMENKQPNAMETIVSLCKQRGFIFPASEIYGGVGAVYEYGPLGAELKKNIRDSWWRTFVTRRPDVYGMEGSILQATRAWEASGHLKEFSDPLVECKVCHQRFREDQAPAKGDDGHAHEFTEAKQFNLMFKTHMGPVESKENVAYLRPETAQSMFEQFKLIQSATRAKLPFGIAQSGRNFRNEITTGNFSFRQREFEIMEVEYFVKPEQDEQPWKEWTDQQEAWLTGLGLPKEKLRRYDHPKDGLAHYSKGTTDIEFEFPFGWGELTGNARRTDFDLTNHQTASGQNLEYFDEEEGKSYLPWVVEPTFGLDRILLATIIASYKEEEVEGEKRIVLALDKKIAPVKVAVLPLSKKSELSEPAKKLRDELLELGNVDYDESGSIGKRYRRQDEVGTPYCVTFDFESLTDNAVTVRDRDTMKQDRIPTKDLVEHFQKLFHA